METPAAFTVRGLTKVYGQGHGAVHALRGIDLDIPEGELVVLLGPSGSGKSTLLNILGGLDRPTAGTLHFRTQDLTACSDRELTAYRRRHVGFVFQFYNLIPSLTARENVGLITELARAPLTPEAALGMVGLTARMDHFPAQLSGGEQQRVSIARALANDPVLLLADEPTAALDGVRGRQVMEAFRKLADEHRVAVCVVTHDPRWSDIFDRIVEMSDGRVVATRPGGAMKARLTL